MVAAAEAFEITGYEREAGQQSVVEVEHVMQRLSELVEIDDLQGLRQPSCDETCLSEVLRRGEVTQLEPDMRYRRRKIDERQGLN